MNSFSVTLFQNEPKHICLHAVNWFQVLQPNTDNLTSVICFQAVKLFQVLLFNTNNPI